MKNKIELKELTDSVIELFGITSPDKLGECLFSACADTDKLDSFCELIGNNLNVDWLQKIYQYYLADRDEKKQDYTPVSIARFMGLLAGDSEEVVDLCAGSGALIIQKWVQNPNAKFIAIEFDENVIPFLIFNLVLRNIRCDVFHMNALTDDGPMDKWRIARGEKYGYITHI